jgi:hypothetical protein
LIKIQTEWFTAGNKKAVNGSTIHGFYKNIYSIRIAEIVFSTTTNYLRYFDFLNSWGKCNLVFG